MKHKHGKGEKDREREREEIEMVGCRDTSTVLVLSLHIRERERKKKKDILRVEEKGGSVEEVVFVCHLICDIISSLNPSCSEINLIINYKI